MQKKLLTILYIVFLVILFININSLSHSISDLLIDFALPFIGVTSLLLVSYRVSGNETGKPLPNSSEILSEIKKANSILLHCHPSPDPDSVGSVLAMKFALESLGKKVTVIQGDTGIPESFMHFPGARDIVKKSFGEITIKDFDLFIILDSGSPEMVSRKNLPEFPLQIKSIVIDHHSSNKKYADINLVEHAPSTTFVLYKLFKQWGITITPEIASNLFIGLYTDTGAFKFPPTDHETFKVASELTAIAPKFTDLIFAMENSQTKENIYFEALALNSIKTYLNDTLVVSTVSYKDLVDKNISNGEQTRGIGISNILKSVVGWDIAVAAIEREPNVVKLSLRTRNQEKYDVSRLAVALGGGGHKGAAGAVLTTSLDEAVAKVVETAKVLYNL
jgi:phosphoesterase RecJ-like protein